MRRLPRKKHLSIRVSAAALILILAATIWPAQPIEEYVYYGAVPSRIYYAKPKEALPGQAEYDLSKGFEIDPSSVARYGLLCIAATRDGTTLRVYELPGNELISEAELDEMEKHFVKLPNGTIFKVVSNKIVSVMLIGGNIGGKDLKPDLPEAPTAQTFYTSTDGSYVGKEFIFIACQSSTGAAFKIIALEPADVTVTREDGQRITFKLQANSYKALQLYPFKAYRVKATGNIMIQSGWIGGWWTRSLWIPTPEGGFAGTVFYTAASRSYWPASDDGFRISSLEDSEVKIWDLEFKKIIQKVQMRAGTGVSVRPRANAIVVESDRPVTLTYINNGTIERELTYGAGVTYFTVKPDQEFLFFLPTNSTVQAFIFAYQETLATIDDAPITIQADSYYKITSGGFHKIRADRSLLVQVIHWPLIPPFQGIQFFGTAIPCIQTIETEQKVKLTPLAGEALPATYLIAAAGTAATVAAAILYMRRGRRQPSQK
jgi:hypothetical protein